MSKKQTSNTNNRMPSNKNVYSPVHVSSEKAATTTSAADVTAISPNKDEKKNVVFSSDASYHPGIWCLLAMVPLSTFITFLYKCVLHPEEQEEEERKDAVRGLLFGTIAILIVFCLVLPKSFQVRSDASITVVTFMGISWNFPNATAAYEQHSIFSEWYRPKIKFAVDFRTKKRIVVRRKYGGWDLLVSPQDPTGFIQAVWDVANKKENNKDGNDRSLLAHTTTTTTTTI